MGSLLRQTWEYKSPHHRLGFWGAGLILEVVVRTLQEFDLRRSFDPWILRFECPKPYVAYKDLEGFMAEP